MTIARACALHTLLMGVSTAAAAGADNEAPPPPSARPLTNTPFQLVLPHAHFLGDWLGTRTWLEEHGLTATVSFVTDAVGNATGGRRQGFTATNNLGVDVLADLQKIFGVAGGSFEISFSERFGTSLTEEHVGNVFSVQQIFPGTYRLVDVAYRQKLLDQLLPERSVGRRLEARTPR